MRRYFLIIACFAIVALCKGQQLEIKGSAADAKIKFGGTGGDAHHISSLRDIVFNSASEGTSPAFVFRRSNFDNLSQYNNLVWILGNGNVGIGTTKPQYKLDIEGEVQAHAYHTGEIHFQKGDEKLWRMFEDEEGLYLENLVTGKVYRFVLQEVEKKKED